MAGWGLVHEQFLETVTLDQISQKRTGYDCAHAWYTGSSPRAGENFRSHVNTYIPSVLLRALVRNGCPKDQVTVFPHFLIKRH